jgi:hypothetical protein
MGRTIQWTGVTLCHLEGQLLVLVSHSPRTGECARARFAGG